MNNLYGLPVVCSTVYAFYVLVRLYSDAFEFFVDHTSPV